MSDEHIDLLAETMCAAYWADMAPAGKAPIWASLPPISKGNWRRAARAALRTIQGNRHWIGPAHDQSALRQQSDAAQVDDRGPGRPNLNPLEAGEP